MLVGYKTLPVSIAAVKLLCTERTLGVARTRLRHPSLTRYGSNNTETAIIGGGQTGVPLARGLAAAGRDNVLIRSPEAACSIGTISLQ
jgi:hypothetical protein